MQLVCFLFFIQWNFTIDFPVCLQQLFTETKQVELLYDGAMLNEASLHTGGRYITLQDAESILGESAHMTQSSSNRRGEYHSYMLSYLTKSIPMDSAKRGGLYLLVEHFKSEGAAHKKYQFIKDANANHDGVKTLYDVGDEAYFHTDRENFYFIMVRKGKAVFNLKLNKITKTTSLENFNKVARKVTTAL